MGGKRTFGVPLPLLIFLPSSIYVAPSDTGDGNMAMQWFARSGAFRIAEPENVIVTIEDDEAERDSFFAGLAAGPNGEGGPQA